MSQLPTSAELQDAVARFEMVDRRVAAVWSDQARRAFQTRTIVPLQQETRLAQQAIDELNANLTAALRQLG